MPISFDRAAESYDQTRGYPPGIQERIGEALLNAAGATSRSRILELGIGTGRIALPIIRAGYSYTGIDISPRMMERLRATLLTIPNASQRVQLIEGDITSMPFFPVRIVCLLSAHDSRETPVYFLQYLRIFYDGKAAPFLLFSGDGQTKEKHLMTQKPARA